MFKSFITRWRPAVIPMAIGLVVAYGAFGYSSASIRGQEVAADREIGNRLKNEITGNFEQVRTVLEGVVAFWSSSETVTQEEFMSYASRMAPSAVGLVAVDYVDEDGVTRYVYSPDEHFSKDVGLDLKTLPRRAEAMRQAREMGVYAQTGPVILSPGMPGSVSFSPLVAGGRPAGFLAGVVSLPEIFARAAGEASRLGYDGFMRTEGFILSLDGEHLYSDDGLLYVGPDGEKSADIRAPVATEGATVVPMILGSRQWELVIHRHGPSTQSLGYLYAILSTLAAALLVAMAIALRRRNATLQEALSREREFVSIVSHQLREPLTQLSWSCDTMMEDESIPTERRCQMGKMHEIVRHAVRLTSDLLNVSRLERGVLHLEIEDLPLATIIDDVMSVMKEPAEQRKIEFKMNLPSGLNILADRIKVVEALRNVIDNAIRYSPEGSTIEMVAVAHRGEVQLAIADQGPGIPEAIRASFFERSSAAVRRTAGTGAGLGMYLTKMFLDRMKGRISFKTSDQGTTFLVTLPMADGK